ncbi:MAG: energy transducer TonB [Prolixibacteraceae bacterium]|jgi:protein TonB|nr:energy transducer TonB [Prolixibacteraceae bacterium]
MELKKSPKADLENKRNIFVQLGLVVALAISLYSFESTSKVDQVGSLGTVADQTVEEEIIPVTRQDEVKPPPPPPPPKVVDMLVIVDDNTEIEDELEIEDTEATDKTAITAVMQVAEEKEEEKEEAAVFFIVEEMPDFPGGQLALRKFIAQAIKYPVIAQENGIQGKVFVNFVVNKDGSVTGAKIARGVDPALDKEALRVVNSLPKWKPGKQGGKPVRVSYTVPINFVLQ